MILCFMLAAVLMAIVYAIKPSNEIGTLFALVMFVYGIVMGGLCNS